MFDMGVVAFGSETIEKAKTRDAAAAAARQGQVNEGLQRLDDAIAPIQQAVNAASMGQAVDVNTLMNRIRPPLEAVSHIAQQIGDPRIASIVDSVLDSAAATQGGMRGLGGTPRPRRVLGAAPSGVGLMMPILAATPYGAPQVPGPFSAGYGMPFQPLPGPPGTTPQADIERRMAGAQLSTLIGPLRMARRFMQSHLNPVAAMQGLGLLSATPPGGTPPSFWTTLLRMGLVGALAYHGATRTGSLGWGAAWALGGAVSDRLGAGLLGFAAYQGYGKPKATREARAVYGAWEDSAPRAEERIPEISAGRALRQTNWRNQRDRQPA